MCGGDAGILSQTPGSVGWLSSPTPRALKHAPSCGSQSAWWPQHLGAISQPSWPERPWPPGSAAGRRAHPQRL